ncbi:nucleoid-associated protein [Pseudoduganella aquatica]|uniref:nucleoid-associated protein n=1 Tax=Pseudoduganella aquatica TaxID=2660641 RepID=UPI001E432763|nr:nucleoid-associated protein [Pseudoduganella aquatica]
MGFFTDDELGSLKITNMILHVVGGDKFEPAPAREVEHAQFFLARILNTDASPVYSFDADSATKSEVQQIFDANISFEDGAQKLAKEFSKLHVKTSSDGALFMFELTVADADVRLYSLIKYDYREAIEQSQGAKGLLRRIVHAFIADKKAIQKSALIRVKNGAAEGFVSTTDRMKQAPDIGDYFAKFLGVSRSLSDEDLNRKTVEMLRGFMADNKELLPDRDAAKAFGVAKGILRDRQTIDEDAITDAILTAAGNIEDEGISSKLRNLAARRIRSNKLDGISFKPNKKVLTRPALRKVRTVEGVTIMYPDQDGAVAVHREKTAQGGETITIETAKIMEDTLVRN